MCFAPLGRRIGSAMIDFFLLSLAAFVQFSIGYAATATYGRFASRVYCVGIWIACSNLIVFAIIALEVKAARTIGKAATALIVRRADGIPAPYRQLLGRTALKYLAPLIFWAAFMPMLAVSPGDQCLLMLIATGLAAALNILGFLAAFASAQKRTLIDKITGTAVFLASSEGDSLVQSTFGFPVIFLSDAAPPESPDNAPMETRNEGPRRQ